MEGHAATAGMVLRLMLLLCWWFVGHFIWGLRNCLDSNVLNWCFDASPSGLSYSWVALASSDATARFVRTVLFDLARVVAKQQWVQKVQFEGRRTYSGVLGCMFAIRAHRPRRSVRMTTGFAWLTTLLTRERIFPALSTLTGKCAGVFDPKRASEMCMYSYWTYIWVNRFWSRGIDLRWGV